MSDTPETDAVASAWERQGVRNGIADFARKLERQRNELLKSLELYSLPYTMDELRQLAETTSGMGEIPPIDAKREVIRRYAIAKAKGEQL